MYSAALATSTISGVAMSSFGISSIWDLSEGYKILVVVFWGLFFLALASNMVYRIYTLMPIFSNWTKGTTSVMGTKISPLHPGQTPADGVTATVTGTKVTGEPAELLVEKGKEGAVTEQPEVLTGRGAITKVSRSKGNKGIISPEALEMESLMKEEAQLLQGKEDLEEGDDSWCMFLMVQHFKKYEVRYSALIIVNLWFFSVPFTP